MAKQRPLILGVVAVVITLTLCCFSIVRQNFVGPPRPAKQRPDEQQHSAEWITVVPHQRLQSADEKAGANGTCFFSAGAGGKNGTLSIRDNVNSNNPCCSIFDACRFGLPDLLKCAPFGNGTNNRTFRLHDNDSENT